MMVDPMFMIIQILRLFLTAVTPTAVTPIADHFGPYWTILNHIEPQWTSLNHSEPVWTKLNQFETVWTILNQFKPV